MNYPPRKPQIPTDPAEFAKRLKTVAAVQDTLNDATAGSDEQVTHRETLKGIQEEWNNITTALTNIMVYSKMQPTPTMLEMDGTSRHMSRQYESQIKTVNATIDAMEDLRLALKARKHALIKAGDPDKLPEYKVGPVAVPSIAPASKDA